MHACICSLVHLWLHKQVYNPCHGVNIIFLNMFLWQMTSYSFPSEKLPAGWHFSQANRHVVFLQPSPVCLEKLQHRRAEICPCCSWSLQLILKYRNYNINEDTGIAFIHILFILSKKQLSSASLLSPNSASTRDTLLTPKHPGKSDSSMQRSSSPWSLVLCTLWLF